MSRNARLPDLTIAEDATVSNVLNILDFVGSLELFPGDLNGDVDVQVSADEERWVLLRGADARLTANQSLSIHPAPFRALRLSASVGQTADRTIHVYTADRSG